ncbi:hypothetical protein DFJ73DRAFT_944677 [Zopfochytrium polystomum]|nr:hypothetical protein DFJ73DRAFT_944677 [Zopfochytrium polystomum]
MAFVGGRRKEPWPLIAQYGGRIPWTGREKEIGREIVHRKSRLWGAQSAAQDRVGTNSVVAPDLEWKSYRCDRGFAVTKFLGPWGLSQTLRPRHDANASSASILSCWKRTILRRIEPLLLNRPVLPETSSEILPDTCVGKLRGIRLQTLHFPWFPDTRKIVLSKLESASRREKGRGKGELGRGRSRGEKFANVSLPLLLSKVSSLDTLRVDLRSPVQSVLPTLFGQYIQSRREMEALWTPISGNSLGSCREPKGGYKLRNRTALLGHFIRRTNETVDLSVTLVGFEDGWGVSGGTSGQAGSNNPSDALRCWHQPPDHRACISRSDEREDSEQSVSARRPRDLLAPTFFQFTFLRRCCRRSPVAPTGASTRAFLSSDARIQQPEVDDEAELTGLWSQPRPNLNRKASVTFRLLKLHASKPALQHPVTRPELRRARCFELKDRGGMPLISFGCWPLPASARWTISVGSHSSQQRLVRLYAVPADRLRALVSPQPQTTRWKGQIVDTLHGALLPERALLLAGSRYQHVQPHVAATETTHRISNPNTTSLSGRNTSPSQLKRESGQPSSSEDSHLFADRYRTVLSAISGSEHRSIQPSFKDPRSFMEVLSDSPHQWGVSKDGQ